MTAEADPLAILIAEAIRTVAVSFDDDTCLDGEEGCWKIHPVHSVVETEDVILAVEADVEGLANYLAPIIRKYLAPIIRKSYEDCHG
jgi:hypothetical protein